MSHQYDDNPMAGHEVDGIQELDNRLPRWWVWLFNITILFSAAYLLYFHVFNLGDLQATQYEKEMARARGQPPSEGSPLAAAEGARARQASLDQPSNDPEILAKGKTIFAQNCAMCHAPDGGGLIGPNLCDDYFIHGPTFADSVHIIKEGVPAKGMIAWKNTLRPDDIHAVASFIYSLRGTTPANPKPPEGVKAEG